MGTIKSKFYHILTNSSFRYQVSLFAWLDLVHNRDTWVYLQFNPMSSLDLLTRDYLKKVSSRLFREDSCTTLDFGLSLRLRVVLSSPSIRKTGLCSRPWILSKIIPTVFIKPYYSHILFRSPWLTSTRILIGTYCQTWIKTSGISRTS